MIRPKLNIKFAILYLVILSLIILSPISISAASKNDDFVVVLDAGHGGKDYGAIDNNVNEKDINLAVAKRVAELIRKKLKDTEVVMTREDDSFVSLQGRADKANKAKGDLFISIHTNSVDTKNKNRANIAGASVYTLGANKDEANMAIARRENAVIVMESDHAQKYSGFDPNKDESYIIFEMAQKKNLSQSNRFAKMVQDNLVKIAGRKDRGVKQAGFWVLWSTSMPAVLVELDFICNPESAEFMTSKDGVDKMAEAIFQAVKVYEQNYRQSLKMAERNAKKEDRPSLASSDKKKDKKKLQSGKDDGHDAADEEYLALIADITAADAEKDIDAVAISYRPGNDERDKSHIRLEATRQQRRARTTSDGRRRRSHASRMASAERNVEGEIALLSEFTGENGGAESVKADMQSPKDEAEDAPAKGKKKKNKKSSKKISTKKYASPEKADKSKKSASQGNPGDDKNRRGKNAAGESGEKTEKELKAERKAREKEMKEAQRKAMREQKEKDKNKKSGKPTGKNEKEDKKKLNGNQDGHPEKKESPLNNEEHAGKRKSLKRKIN